MGTNVEDLSAGGHIDLPPGFRFHPTDEEVITSYLMEKIINSCFSPIAMGEVDLNRCEPWDLPSKAKNSGEKEWYFYCQKDMKYPTGTRTNRATESGYWKATGKDKEIYRGKGNLVGMKKTLVFYKGRAPRGGKTNWVMHEFRMEGKSFFNKAEMNEWVVCRVSCKNTEPIKKYDQNIRASSPSSSSSMAVNCFDNDLLFDTQTIPPLVEINPSHNSFNRTNLNSITKNNSSFTSCTDHIKASSSTTIPIQNQNQFQYSSENFISAEPGLFQLKSPIDGRNSYSSETTPQSFSYFYPQLFIPATRFIPTPTTMNSSLQPPHDRTINIEGLTDPNRIAQMRSHGTSSIQGGEGGEGLVSWRCKEEQYSNQSLVTSSPAVINDRSTSISSAFPVPELDRTQSFDDINQLLSSVGSLSDMESIWNY